MTLSIHALHVGTLHDFPSAAMTYQRGFAATQDVAIIMFVILGGPSPVIVDTGTGTPEYTGTCHPGFSFERGDDQEPAAALRRLGVDPADVKIVVNTHLHWDHSSNNDLFPNATVYVQRTELAYAIAPAEPTRTAYENSRTVSPPWLGSLTRVTPVDGDMEIADGVKLIHLPGHTPGSQGVLVSSAEKRFLLAGDNVGTYANWEGERSLTHIPNGSFTNLLEYEKTFRKIENLGCEVIPSHDMKVVEVGVFKG